MNNGLADDKHCHDDDDHRIGETGQGLPDGEHAGDHEDKDDKQGNDVAAHPAGDKKEYCQGEGCGDDEQFTVHDVSLVGLICFAPGEPAAGWHKGRLEYPAHIPGRFDDVEDFVIKFTDHGQ